MLRDKGEISMSVWVHLFSNIVSSSKKLPAHYTLEKHILSVDKITDNANKASNSLNLHSPDNFLLTISLSIKVGKPLVLMKPTEERVSGR